MRRPARGGASPPERPFRGGGAVVPRGKGRREARGPRRESRPGASSAVARSRVNDSHTGESSTQTSSPLEGLNHRASYGRQSSDSPVPRDGRGRLLVKHNTDGAGAGGFEPPTAGLGTRCPLQARLRAHGPTVTLDIMVLARDRPARGASRRPGKADRRRFSAPAWAREGRSDGRRSGSRPRAVPGRSGSPRGPGSMWRGPAYGPYDRRPRSGGSGRPRGPR